MATRPPRLPGLRSSLRGRHALALSLMLSACTDADIGLPTNDGSVPTRPDGSSKPDAGSAPRDAATQRTEADADVDDPTELPYVPTLADDAGEPQPPAVTVLPDWASPLLGRFAARAFTFKQDDLGALVRSEDIYLSVFAFTPEAGLTLRSKLCLSRASSAAANVQLSDPSGVPERVEQVVLSELEQKWSTEAPTLAIGFTRSAPAQCTGKAGQSVPKPAAQVWTPSTTCRCALPTDEPALDDCRVLDPDGDNKPGFSFTYESLVPVLGDATLYVVSNSDTHYANGTVSADGKRHAASVSGGEHLTQLDCEPFGCADLTKRGRYCPLAVNPARFVPLDASADCARVLADYASLFPEPAPERSERCYP